MVGNTKGIDWLTKELLFAKTNNSEKSNKHDVRLLCSYHLRAKSTVQLNFVGKIFFHSVKFIT